MIHMRGNKKYIARFQLVALPSNGKAPRTTPYYV